MRGASRLLAQAALLASATVFLAGCNQKTHADLASGAPPPAQVEHEQNSFEFKVDHPEQFPLVAAGEHKGTSLLSVTGTVAPDVSRNIPVISLASGRVVEIAARLGDTVKKGQLMLKVQSPDISQAFSDYRQAVADEKLASSQLERSKVLFDRGAVAQKDVEVAEDADVKAKVGVETAMQRLRVLGVTDLDHPDSIVNVYAPASGVVTDQQVTAAGGTQGLASPNAFTISDLSHVWILCDVHENDLPSVRLGDYADVRLNAYPDRLFRGRISNIGAILDPTIRTAKVRLEMENPGLTGSPNAASRGVPLMRLGMFVTATFHGRQQETRATVPSSAILHLRDRDWVYVPADAGKFRRVEVVAGEMLPGNLQEIVSGIQPGQQVIGNALSFENTVEQ